MLLKKIEPKDISEKVVHKFFALFPIKTSDNEIIWLEPFYYYDDGRIFWIDRTKYYNSKKDFYNLCKEEIKYN